VGHPKDEARHAVSLHEASRTADHRPDADLHTALVERVLIEVGLRMVAIQVQPVVLIMADLSTVDAKVTAMDGLNTGHDQKAAEKVDVHRDLRTVDLVMADLAVSTTIVRDLLVENVVRTEIVVRLDRKAKADQSDVKLL
jgi:hypothetical protein